MHDSYIKLKPRQGRRILKHRYREIADFVTSPDLELSAIILELKKCGPLGDYKLIRGVTNSKISISKLSGPEFKITNFYRYLATIRALEHNCIFLEELKKKDCDLPSIADKPSFSYINKKTSQTICVRNDRTVSELTPYNIQVVLKDSIELVEKFENSLDIDNLCSVIKDFQSIHDKAVSVKISRIAEANKFIEFLATEQGAEWLNSVKTQLNELNVVKK